MPIYAYRCESCGHAKDVLQKLSDAPLTDCPSCGAPAFKKQLTAAGFQLKGSGWYATDFKSSSSAKPAAEAPACANSTDGTAATCQGPCAAAAASSAASAPSAASGTAH